MRDGTGDGLRAVIRGDGEDPVERAAAQQRRGGDLQHLRDARNLLQRGRPLAALQPPEVQLGDFQQLCGLFLREPGPDACLADIPADGLV